MISEDHSTAYVPIYGDGIHGEHPNPGHLIAVIDLPRRRHIGDFSVAPYLAPHGMRWGSNGRLYYICENSGVVLEMKPENGNIDYVLAVGSNIGHRIEIIPDGSKLYAETEEDGFLSIIDLRSRTSSDKLRLPTELDGLGMSPDGWAVVVVSGQEPLLFVVNTTSDELVSTIRLTHHEDGVSRRGSWDGLQHAGF